MGEMTAHSEQLGDQLVHWYAAPGADPPILYIHGVPDSGELWQPFLERTGGLAVDLPGFGRSGKRGDGDYTIGGYDRFLEDWLDARGIERLSLVMHDWGTVGLAFAQRFPERIERLVIIDGVTFLPGYRWHRVARLWRKRGVGELMMGLTNKAALRTELSKEHAERVMAHFDQGTQRAILQLYRSSPEDVLAAAGERLGAINCPALVIWGERDPYIPAKFADAYAEALPNAELLRFPDAGHWPWLDQPDVVNRVTSFLTG